LHKIDIFGKVLIYRILPRLQDKKAMVKKYYSATFHPKVGRLRFVNVPFAWQKATL